MQRAAALEHKSQGAWWETQLMEGPLKGDQFWHESINLIHGTSKHKNDTIILETHEFFEIIKEILFSNMFGLCIWLSDVINYFL